MQRLARARRLTASYVLLASVAGGCRSHADTPPSGHEIAHLLGFTGVGSISLKDPVMAQQFLDSMGYADEAAAYEDIVAHMKALSAPMARAHFFYAGGGQFVTEHVVPYMQAAGFDLYGWVNPIPTVEGLDEGFEAAFRDLVRAHPEIGYWQLGNEPDLLWHAPALYPAFFARAQRVVRDTCPSCKVVLAGISNQYDTSSSNYQAFEGFVDEIVAAGLPGKPFDVFDFHYYREAPSRSEISAAVASYRGLVESRGIEDVAFWCTETGLYTGDPAAAEMGPRTELDQARDLPKLASWMAAEGVERVYWFTVVESWTQGGLEGFFTAMGLVWNGLGGEELSGIAGGTKKQAYATYQTLAAALSGVAAASRTSAGVYRFDRAQGPAFVVFSEDGSTSVAIEGLSAERVQVRHLVPDSSGQIVAEELPTTGGAITIAVDELPMLVTE